MRHTPHSPPNPDKGLFDLTFLDHAGPAYRASSYLSQETEKIEYTHTLMRQRHHAQEEIPCR